jgi:hypothetical protein
VLLVGQAPLWRGRRRLIELLLWGLLHLGLLHRGLYYRGLLHLGLLFLGHGRGGKAHYQYHHHCYHKDHLLYRVHQFRPLSHLYGRSCGL